MSDLIDKLRIGVPCDETDRKALAEIERLTAENARLRGFGLKDAHERIAELEAIISAYPLTHNRPTDLAIELACWEERAIAALQENKE